MSEPLPLACFSKETISIAVEQAMERSASSERNKGADAARTAIEMVSLLKQLHKAKVRQSGFLR